MISIDVELDARGLRCPMPLMKVSRALKEMQAGQVIRVQATDPGSKRDFEGWTGNTGNILLESTEVDGLYTYLIRKGTQ